MADLGSSDKISSSASTAEKRVSVFISYSRKDLEAAERLRDRLDANGFEAYLDKHDILPGEPWQERLGRLIESADTVVFLLSSDSIASSICDWEVNEAERLAKRLLPVVIRDANDEQVPGRLKRLNYIFMRSEEEEESGFAAIRSALLTNIEWIREHTRLSELALDWQRSKRTDALLLRGEPLAAAERWISQRPDQTLGPTKLHHDFVLASREGEYVRLERDKAQIAATRRAQRRSFALLTLMLIGVLGSAWGVFRFWQAVQTNRSEFIATQSLEQLHTKYDRVTAMLLALEALPDDKAAGVVQRVFPFEATSYLALHDAYHNYANPTWHERTLLAGHGQSIRAGVFSANGRILLTGSGDNTARLWDVASGKLMVTLTGHDHAIEAVAISPDSRLALTGSRDRTARLWDVATGKPVAAFRGHKFAVTTVAFSPDGSRVLTGSNDVAAMPEHDTIARLWDVASATLIATLENSSSVSEVGFSPDGTLALTASFKEARLWDSKTGMPILTLEGHSHFVTAAKFSSDGRILLTGSDDKTARLWEISTGRPIATLEGHEGVITDVALSSDNRYAVTGSGDKTARLWQTTTGRLIATLASHKAYVGVVAFSPDGRLVVTGSDDGTARLWDGVSGKAVAVLGGHENWVRTLAFSPDGRLVMTGSWDATVKLWESRQHTPALRLADRQRSIGTVAFSPNGRLVAIGSGDKTARLLDAKSGKTLVTLEGHQDTINLLTFSPDGRLVATATRYSRWRYRRKRQDNTVRLWEVATGKHLTLLEGQQGAINAIAFSPDSNLILTGSNDKIGRLWNAKTGKSVALLKGHSAPVNQVAFSLDGRLALTASANKVHIWDTVTRKPLATLDCSQYVRSVTFSPDAQLVLTGSGNTARIWEARTGKLLATLDSHKSGIVKVEFSPNGELALTGSSDGTVRLWRAATGVYVATLAASGSPVIDVAFSSDGRLIVAGYNSGTARLWETTSGKHMATFEGHSGIVRQAIISPNGQWVLTRTGTEVQLWSIESAQALVDKAREIVPRCLTPRQREAFHLRGAAPRWCHTHGLWPYDGKSPPFAPGSAPPFGPPPTTWDEWIASALDVIRMYLVGANR